MYSDSKAINATAIKAGAKSMLHMHHAMTNKSEETPAMRWGTLVHEAVLMGIERFAVYPGRRSGKEWDAFEVANSGRTIVSKSEHEKIMMVLESIASNKEAHELTICGEVEKPIYWTDKEAECEAKGRPDVVNRHLVDLKNAKDISERGFTMASWSAGTHLQMAWYLRGLRANGITVERVAIVAVESTPPFDCAVYYYDQSLLNWAERECVRICRDYKLAIESGNFKGAHTFSKTLLQPAFADEVVAGMPDDEFLPDEL